MVVKFQGDWKSLNTNLAASRLHEILGKTSYRLVNRGPYGVHVSVSAKSWIFEEDTLTLVPIYKEMKVLSASGIDHTTVTHWGRVTHICVSKLTIISSDNGLSPGRCQAIIWTNAGILLIRSIGTNFSEIFKKIHTFSFKKMHLKMSSGNWRSFCLG